MDVLRTESARDDDRIVEVLIGAPDGRAMPSAEAGSHVELRFGGEEGHFLRHYSLIGSLTLSRDPEPFWRIAVQREDRAAETVELGMSAVWRSWGRSGWYSSCWLLCGHVNSLQA